jgi:hypothetical protein
MAAISGGRSNLAARWISTFIYIQFQTASLWRMTLARSVFFEFRRQHWEKLVTLRKKLPSACTNYLEFMSWVIDSHLILELQASGRERSYWSDSCYDTSDLVTSVTITPCENSARTQVCIYSIQGNSTGGGNAEGVGNPWQVPVEVGHPRRRCSKRKGSAPEIIIVNLVTAILFRARAETHVRHTGRKRKGYIYSYRIFQREWRHA